MSATDDDLTPLPGSGGSKLPVILTGLNLVLTGAVLFMVLTLPSPGPASAAAAEGGAAAMDKPGPVETLEPFVVNLNEPEGGRYLKAALDIEVVDEKAAADLREAVRVIRDELLRYLSGLKVEHVMGTEAIDKIQAEIVARVDSKIGGTERVKRVFFNQFVVQ